MAVWYCQQVMDGKVPACREEVQACERLLNMRDRALSGEAEFTWSDAHVIDACAFMEQMPHTKAFSGTFVLEPVQAFWLAGIFGFRDQVTGKRYVRSASLWVPRKNGKTFLSVGIALYCATCEGEEGAEVTISAGSEGQAHIPYDAIKAAMKQMPEFMELHKAKITNDWTEFRAIGAKINLATAKAENLDGYNPHMVLAEELHAQSQKVIGVLRTAMGSRSNPLFLTISTGGRDTNAAAYDDWQANLSVLDGRTRNDRLFCVVYRASKDDEDRKFDLKLIEKVNPLYGVSLRKASLEEEIFEAKKSEAKLQEYKRTRLNIWARAAGNIISVDQWNKSIDHKLNLDVFKGLPLYVGIDLASRSDLNAAAFMIKEGDTLYTVGQYWLGRNCERMRDDQFSEQFWAWHKEGWLELTDLHDGTYVDQKVILAQLLATLKGHRVMAIAVDDYQANLLASDIELAGYPVYFVKKTAASLTPATEDLLARVGNPNLLQHDGNPITAWCAGNVVGYWDHKENILPRKEKKNSKANIDGFDALVMANAVRLDHEAGILGQDDKAKPNPYLTRGLAGAA